MRLYLFPLGNIHGLQEWVHVFPAVQLTNSSDICLNDTLECVACTITVDKLLYVSRLDLSAVVEDLSSRGDENLGNVTGSEIDFTVS